MLLWTQDNNKQKILPKMPTRTQKSKHMNKTIKSLKTTKKLVEVVLNKKPLSRDDDKLLIIYCLKLQGMKVTQTKEKTYTWEFTLQDLEQMKSFETITRVRREIQNTEGKYLPTNPEIARQRKIREETIREYYR